MKTYNGNPLRFRKEGRFVTISYLVRDHYEDIEFGPECRIDLNDFDDFLLRNTSNHELGKYESTKLVEIAKSIYTWACAAVSADSNPNLNMPKTESNEVISDSNVNVEIQSEELNTGITDKGFLGDILKSVNLNVLNLFPKYIQLPVGAYA